MTKISFIRGALVGSMVLGLSAVACGGGGGKPNSYAEVVASLQNPSGTVDATSAKDIGPAFDKAQEQGLGAAAIRENVAARSSAQSGTIDQACLDGGKIALSYSGNQQSANINYDYQNCCQGGCCINGSGAMFVSTETTAEYSYCGGFDLTTTCGTDIGTVNYQGCYGQGAGGFRLEYLVTVNDETYAVSATGTYSDGNGELTIRGANGTFVCTYTDGAGSCNGDGEFTF